MKKEEERIADLFVILSAAAVFLGVIDAFGYSVYLAATQWLLIAGILMLWSIFIILKD